MDTNKELENEINKMDPGLDPDQKRNFAHKDHRSFAGPPELFNSVNFGSDGNPSTMKLFEITNGFIGESFVRSYVLAGSESRAIEIFNLRFSTHDEFSKFDINAREVLSDLQSEHVTELSDHGFEEIA